MKHFAKISEDNLVLAVTPVADENALTEAAGQAYLEKYNNWPAHLWIETSKKTLHNTHKEGGTPFRGNFAGIGSEWDATNQIFWSISPYPSWVKDIATASWKSPVGDAPALTEAQLNDPDWGYRYQWNESTTSWDLIKEPGGPGAF